MPVYVLVLLGRGYLGVIELFVNVADIGSSPREMSLPGAIA